MWFHFILYPVKIPMRQTKGFAIKTFFFCSFFNLSCIFIVFVSLLVCFICKYSFYILMLNQTYILLASFNILQ